MNIKKFSSAVLTVKRTRGVFAAVLAGALLFFGGALHNSAGFSTSPVPSLGVQELGAVGIIIKKPKKKPRKKKGKCCSLGIAYTSGPGLVILDRICADRRGTVVKFRTKRLRSICTYPPATHLYDDRKRKYTMIKHAGLPNCIFGTSKKYNQKFTWVFKPLRRGVKKVSIIEQTDPNTAGYSYWAWRNIDISKCGFK